MIGALLAALLALPVTPPPANADWDYQLGGAVAPAANVRVVTRDRTQAPAPGVYDVCYVNAFQTQPGQRRFWRHHQRLLLHDHGRAVVDQAWGEWLLDVGTPAKRRALARIVGRWIDGCARSGYQAVELDNLDSFSRSHHLLTRSDDLALARLLVRRAHRAGLAVGQKNWATLDGRRIGFDFAVAEQCGQYHECDAYLAHYGGEVVDVEYTDAGFRWACDHVGEEISVERRDVDLTPGGVRAWC
ncbi:endo alpha-1,4 polygalactosaminidase [Nocardioides mangrovicus]|uniref:endo alpha-1,4 polygalactosaminidase n=1 Tax=Nocardioides mangrovicus TaxID=2478913 RepID=UPI0018E0A368|nr:endo alpha-1,4 polygalactosaminidase [Nocardioides mangrovicus]